MTRPPLAEHRGDQADVCRPSAQGRGLSRLVLSELEATALSAGIDWLVLETGQPQKSAITEALDVRATPM